MAALLALSGVEAWYGRAKILHGVGFAVGRGEVVALMGRNGAGKSTTLKTVMGLVPQPQVLALDLVGGGADQAA